MTLPAFGQISLNDIHTEFGGGTPVVLSNYYRGGGLVPNTAANSNIPTSGQISLSNFYSSTSSTFNPHFNLASYRTPSSGSYNTATIDVGFQVIAYADTTFSVRPWVNTPTSFSILAPIGTWATGSGSISGNLQIQFSRTSGAVLESSSSGAGPLLGDGTWNNISPFNGAGGTGSFIWGSAGSFVATCSIRNSSTLAILTSATFTTSITGR